MLLGTRLHLLLEHLPDRPRGDWPALAREVLADAEGGLPEDPALDGLLAEAAAVVDAPDLAQVFQLPEDAQVLTEVALAAPLPGIGMLAGNVDRLVVMPDRVLAIDYKSNTEIPATPGDTPTGILRQLGAYRDALRLIYPARRVQAAVLWTRTRSLMWLPDPLLDGVMAALDPAGGRP